MNDKSVTVFGKKLLQHFELNPEYRNLNHGTRTRSFGLSPRDIRKHMRLHQDLYEAAPDSYIRYEYPVFLDECRATAAKLVNAPVDSIVFVPNATTGVNTVLHNIPWDGDGKDEIMHFNTIYGACGRAVDYTVDTGRGKVSSRSIDISYPCEDEDIIDAFHTALNHSTRAGKRVRICIFDTVSSLPGVRFPFEAMTKACRDNGVLSLVDGAQGVGMVDIDLGSLDPDFFVSNCHKWLFVPRSCAVFYVPLRNQHLIVTTLPTSLGYTSKSGSRFNPLPPSAKSAFINNFQFVGTLDTSPLVCVKQAIEWRERVLGGESRIREYNQTLAREGGQVVARILGTEALDNKARSMSRCAMTNVALPIDVSLLSAATLDWMMRTMVKEYKTFIAMITHADRLWARLSAQVYLDLDDFEWAGRILLELCERVKKGEHNGS
ncbi:pyridoxal phosphate-dependent transferase [Xylaria sp. CBS 124048]|nr:pyridoxal phosphate-dependent transferase [Xylaria sp. CBS 124048]